ncbi:uncharacterized protein DUF1236 [Rhizobium sp. ERR 922]|uniref:DUF1236 domain-containing protein n=1 Tax=Rhizobium dioscoreae TaxID=2653122 RepID=A0ABQ0Z7T5_9HYPH|nr:MULTISPECIES: DUF1236 domain-containing protein [Rhizobium]MCZ3374810.1 DUF1236 domain-containing protein [Rhizobium sp. AG207R]TWB13564.1 uncharacterized protein DUF1236 [Rhizobium sp. ERR1071]TWB43560.1 uncharacterized protein DUF1236 [Rhizobium sp. ERR 922]TWB87375.1 uncharacterized protein DUF1236 [Rhizobium sp. ERR 942]GES41280.1 hypothetical protein RsS62_05320 [Rhizobium dioscoreae]
MRTRLIVSAVAAFGLLAGSALAQSSTVTGAAGGAATGAVVGGPVGAAVGGVAGAIAGTAIDPPPQKVITYVQEQPLPPTETVVQDQIVVGRTLPETVAITPVPDNPTYGYAVVNHERVIVQPKTRKIVRIVE